MPPRNIITSCGRGFSGSRRSPLNVLLYAAAKASRATITRVVISEDFHALRGCLSDLPADAERTCIPNYGHLSYTIHPTIFGIYHPLVFIYMYTYS